MIRISRTVSPAAPAAVDAVLKALEDRPGLWMGCDVEADGLFRKESCACAVSALRFCLDGADLTVTPLSASGVALLPAFRDIIACREAAGELRVRMASGVAVIDALRRFLADFHPVSPELALYGAFSFDYYRLGENRPLPDDGRRRLVAYLPERVLVAAGGEARWIDFTFSAAQPLGVADAIPAIAPVRIESGEIDPPVGAHAARVAKGIEALRRGELYSLVLSQTFRRRTDAKASEAFGALRERNPYPAMFFCNLGGGEMLFGASPDIQVRGDARCVDAAPVCGTLPRGADPLGDASQALALLDSEKEAASLALCADSAAEDLAAVCEPGSVRLVSRRRVHFFSTIIHTVDHLRGDRRPGLDGFELLLRHAVPATVGGLPKQHAVRAIDELEQDWRGWYAGAVARVGADGSVEAYTVLRAARLAAGIAEVRVGGNVLVDSDPSKEEEETRLKAQTLFRVLAHVESANSPLPLRPWRIGTVFGNDPFRHRLLDAVARAGGRFSHAGRIALLSGPPAEGNVPADPLLAIGPGALWLMRTHGAGVERFAVPRFAREVTGYATRHGFLCELGAMHVGWYALEGIRAGLLPRGWFEAAVSAEGWVLAAQRRDGMACAILFQPDSILSLRDAIGIRALHAAFVHLDPRGMFDADSRQEER